MKNASKLIFLSAVCFLCACSPMSRDLSGQGDASAQSRTVTVGDQQIVIPTPENFVFDRDLASGMRVPANARLLGVYSRKQKPVSAVVFFVVKPFDTMNVPLEHFKDTATASGQHLDKVFRNLTQAGTFLKTVRDKEDEITELYDQRGTMAALSMLNVRGKVLCVIYAVIKDPQRPQESDIAFVSELSEQVNTSIRLANGVQPQQP